MCEKKLCDTDENQDLRSATYAQGVMEVILHGCAYILNSYQV